MKTQDLIKALAADNGRRPLEPDRSLALALAAIAIATPILFLMLLGPRPDLDQALSTIRFDLKLVATMLLALPALWLVRRAALPYPSRQTMLALLPVPVLMVAAVAAELVALPTQAWAAATLGQNALVCLTYIPLLGLGPLALLILFLRGGAPTRPALAGALAGVAAGGIAAFLYAFHCTDDSPLFVMLWYSIAIALLAMLGAAIGARLLRW